MIVLKSNFICCIWITISSVNIKETPVYNFLIKNAVQDFLLYNEFDQNITKDSDPVRQTYYTMKKL